MKPLVEMNKTPSIADLCDPVLTIGTTLGGLLHPRSVTLCAALCAHAHPAKVRRIRVAMALDSALQARCITHVVPKPLGLCTAGIKRLAITRRDPLGPLAHEVFVGQQHGGLGF